MGAIWNGAKYAGGSVVDGISLVMLLGSAGGNFASGDWEVGLMQAHAAALQGAQMGLQHYSKYKGTDLWKQATPILSKASKVTTVLNQLVGGGNEKGESLETTAGEFEEAYNSLHLAIADAGYWSGDAADAYNAQTRAQLPRMTEMARLDRELVQILVDQAHQVHLVKQVIMGAAAAIAAAIPIALLLQQIEPGGPAISTAFEISITVATLVTALSMFIKQIVDSEGNAAKITAAAADYRSQGDGAYLDGPDEVQVSVTAEKESRVDSVDPLSPGASGVPSTVGTFSGSNGAGESSLAGATTASEAGVGSSAEHAPAGWGHATARAAVSPIVGGVPSTGQGSSTAAAGDPRPSAKSPKDARGAQPNGAVAEAPAAGETAPTGEFEGAASGAKGTERAPIDDAAGTDEQLAASTPTGRAL